MRTLFLALLCSGVASAQLFSAGIKAGIPVTDSFADVSTPQPGSNLTVHTFSNSKKFVAGGMVEVHLPFGFSVEADGLYRPLRLITESGVTGSTAFGKDSQNFSTWELPVVAKYRFLHTPLIKPYVEAGPDFRFLSAPIDHFMSNHGFVLGGGIEFKLSRLRIAPELRYTRWGSDSNFTFYSRSNQNQGELLLGLSF